jgi:hypothetical protein
MSFGGDEEAVPDRSLLRFQKQTRANGSVAFRS